MTLSTLSIKWKINSWRYSGDYYQSCEAPDPQPEAAYERQQKEIADPKDFWLLEQSIVVLQHETWPTVRRTIRGYYRTAKEKPNHPWFQTKCTIQGALFPSQGFANHYDCPEQAFKSYSEIANQKAANIGANGIGKTTLKSLGNYPANRWGSERWLPESILWQEVEGGNRQHHLRLFECLLSTKQKSAALPMLWFDN